MKRFGILVLVVALLTVGVVVLMRKDSSQSASKNTTSPSSTAENKGTNDSQPKLEPIKTSPNALCGDCNVVVILIDTLRADHLPFYGYSKNTAPFLSTIAEKSAVFERAFSASSWTAPATASVFTSLYPSQHGVITGFAATKQLQKREYEIKMNRIPPDIRTLGEYMSQAGFATIAVADNLNIGHEMGFDRGFKYFHQYRSEGAEAVNKKAMEFMDQVYGKEKYFLYLHYMDPHSPYLKHEPFFSECKAKHKKEKKMGDICAYDSEILFTDEQIQKMFERYKFLDNSIVILLSDHGEEFWEHGGTGHGKTLYTEVIHVPLVLYHPKIKSTRVKENVHTMDILPTLASLLGTPPIDAWEGFDLIPYLSGKGDAVRGIISDKIRHPEIAAKRSKRRWTKRSVVKSDWHYINTEDPGKPVGTELFDLKTDFFGQTDLSPKHPNEIKDLQSELARYPDNVWQKYNEGIEMEVDQEMLNNLRSLGYVD